MSTVAISALTLMMVVVTVIMPEVKAEINSFWKN